MSKVVTFSRSADYLHQKAMRNRREGSMLDALDLMRGALEREPDNLEYLMDLAELYCEMGCHRQSIHMLLYIQAFVEPLPECLFGMCCNYMGMQDSRAAYSLLMRFLLLEPDAIRRDEVGETLSALIRTRQDAMISGRKRRRAMSLTARGQSLMLARNPSSAAAMFQKSLLISPRDQDAAALLAICLLSTGDSRGALRQIKRALSGRNPSVRTRCIASEVFHVCGYEARAHEQLELLLRRDRNEHEERLLIHVAEQIGHDQLVHQLTFEALKALPYDAGLLHARAVSIIRLGMPAQDAKPLWDRAVRIDPGDTVSMYYAERCARGELELSKLPYQHEVPRAEVKARAEYLVGLRLEGPERVNAAWAESPRLRNLLRWAMCSDDEELSQTALGLILMVREREAELTLREQLLWPGFSSVNAARVRSELKARGAKPPLLVRDEHGEIVELKEADQIKLSPAQRRVLVKARQAQRPGKSRGSGLVEPLWRGYIAVRGHRSPRVARPGSWAAALLAIRLKLTEEPEALELLSSVFGCPGRMIRRRIHTIQRAMPREEPTNATD